MKTSDANWALGSGVAVVVGLMGAGLGSCGEQSPPPLSAAKPAVGGSAEGSPAAAAATVPAAVPASVPAPSPASAVTPDVTGGTGDALVASAGELVAAGPIRVKVPSGWIAEKPSSAMRLLEMRVPADAAKLEPAPGDCLVAFFSFGGDVAGNLERWRGMVLDAEGKPSAAEAVVSESGGLKVHTIEMVGTYMDGMPGGPRTPREAWMFRGAVIETPERLTFIRMTGPEAAMKAAAEGWGTLVGSVER